jgi:hypothetical protein
MDSFGGHCEHGENTARFDDLGPTAGTEVPWVSLEAVLAVEKPDSSGSAAHRQVG